MNLLLFTFFFWFSVRCLLNKYGETKKVFHFHFKDFFLHEMNSCGVLYTKDKILIKQQNNKLSG